MAAGTVGAGGRVVAGAAVVLGGRVVGAAVLGAASEVPGGRQIREPGYNGVSTVAALTWRSVKTDTPRRLARRNQYSPGWTS